MTLTRPLVILACAIGLSLATATPAAAAKRKTTKQQQQQTEQAKATPEEVGVLRQQDVHVVQKQLFTKAGRAEVGFNLSGTWFDPYVVGIQGGFDLNLHKSEQAAFHLEVQGGWGFGNQHHAELTNDVFDVSLGTDARRILVGAAGGIQLSPIYAKFSLAGKKVVHNDIYFFIGAAGFLGQGVEPGIGLTPLVGPSLGIGARIWINPKTTLRFDLKDHITIEKRAFSGGVAPVNNLVFTVGVSALTSKK